MIEADIYGNVNSTHIMEAMHRQTVLGLRRLRAQRLPVDLHDASRWPRTAASLHRAHGLARGPHRARCADSRSPNKAWPTCAGTRLTAGEIIIEMRAPGLRPPCATIWHARSKAPWVSTPHLLGGALSWHQRLPWKQVDALNRLIQGERRVCRGLNESSSHFVKPEG